jgi:hypothetical protein
MNAGNGLPKPAHYFHKNWAQGRAFVANHPVEGRVGTQERMIRMTPDFALTVATIMLYRLGVLALGGLSIWLGYKLFRAGLFDKSADEIQMVFGKNKILAKAAAPGTVFALFGAVVITVSICFPAQFKITPAKDGDHRTPAVSEAGIASTASGEGTGMGD